MTRVTSLALVVLVLAPGCVDEFDPRLYQAREAEAGAARDVGTDDAGMDGGTDGGVDGGTDAFVDDAGMDAGTDAPTDAAVDVGVDAFIPTLGLADFCTTAGLVPVIPRPASPTTAVNTAYLIDTTGLTDDVSDVAACTGMLEPGRDGFASVMMMAGERWHFHLRRPGTQNAALYVLDSSCDERTCSGGQGQDLCGTSSDEHFSFVAPSSGLYFIGVDAETSSGGFMGELDVIFPVCGDHMKQHSEGCDDGGTTPGDGCDAVCRAELASGASEIEANDDAYSANHLVLAASGTTTVNARIASACESDVFAFDVPAGETGDVTVSLGLTTGGCPANDVVPVSLTVLSTNGTTVLATTTLGAAGGCPTLGGAAPLTTLAPGTYFARVRSIGTMAPDRPLDYTLTLTTAFTP